MPLPKIARSSGIWPSGPEGRAGGDSVVSSRAPTLAHGSKLWLGLTAYVVATDAHAALSGRETLSMAFYRAIRHPLHRPWVILSWGYLTLHLFNFLPQRYDPLRREWRKVSTT